MLKRRGVSFDVLSRGYGRKTKGVALVHPDGGAAEFGDEPLLIARRLEVSVVIGEDRYAAGRFAEEISARACTCSTMAFSTADWHATSTS